MKSKAKSKPKTTAMTTAKTKSGSPAKKTPSKERRTNVERSAATRAKLIGAAIDLLFKAGHAAATTIAVAVNARVSRGAMLHQFPTRVDLLLATAKHIVAEQTRFRRERLRRESFADGLSRFFAAADVSWAVQTQPSAIALLEIMMATRSDRDLYLAFTPFLKEWVEARKTAAIHVAADLGTTDVNKVETLIRLHQANMRGLAIELMFVRDREQIEKVRALQVECERSIAEQLANEAKIRDGRKNKS